MSARPKIHGWCPTAHRPMVSGDGVILRLRPPLGRISRDQMILIADLAARHGNGWMDVTSRASLQLRGLTAQSHAAALTDLQEAGLVGAAADANILFSPFAARDPRFRMAAAALERALLRADLPSKFGAALEEAGGGALRSASADLRVELSGADTCRVFGDKSRMASDCALADLEEAAFRWIGWFLDQGGVRDGRGRMGPLVDRLGPPDFAMVPLTDPAPRKIALGAGAGAEGFLAALAFGQMQADTLRALAELGPVRLTPWRMVLIEGLSTAPALDDVISDPGDPRLGIVACTGAPGCSQALGPTRSIADLLDPEFARAGVHVSGCAKSCAQPGPAPLTLVARSAGHFDLIVNGSAAAPPTRTNLTQADLAALSDILARETL